MAQGPECLDKGLLHDIFRLGRIVHEARHQAHQAPLVFCHQQVERPAIARLDALNQQLITFAFGRHCNAPLAAAASLLYGNVSIPACADDTSTWARFP